MSQCVARGCERKRRSTYIMCPDCWHAVPAEIRKRTWAASRAYRDKQTKETAAAHWSTIRKAIDSLGSDDEDTYESEELNQAVGRSNNA